MYIGIDIGGTNTAVGLVDCNGRILSKSSIPTLKNIGYKHIVRNISNVVKTVVNQSGFNIEHVKSIGVGCPGTPDTANGIILYSCNLNFNNVPLTAELQKYIDLPVFLENDANCAALAESIAGATKDAKHSVTVTLGTGVGCGIIINKKIYSGFNNSASEMGHSIIRMDGEQCTCGRKGCWEAYASVAALQRQAIAAAQQNPSSLIAALTQGDVQNINGEVVFDAARKGDATAIDIIQNYAIYVAEGVTNIINILSPQVVAIGGGISAQGEYFIEPVREYVRKHVYCKVAEQTLIRVAQLSNDAGIIGAAMLCIDNA